MSGVLPITRRSTAADYTADDLHRRARAMHKSRVAWLNVGWIPVIAAFLLSVIGIAAIATTEPALARRQIAFLGTAVIAGGATSLLHYRWFQQYSLPFMVLMVGLLVFVLIPVVPEAIVRPRNGARRWINLVVTEFQPSEVAKLAYIVALASYLRYRRNYRRFLGLALPFALTFVPMVLILKEPDLGTALLFLPTLFAMLIAAGARLRHLAIIAVLGAATGPAAYAFRVLEPHQIDRIEALWYQILDDDRYVQDKGYQGHRAKRMVGAGGVTGVGDRDHARDLLAYNALPEEHNDMVFAVVCLRWGVLGGAAVWALFTVMCLGSLLVAAICRDPFGRLVAVGIAALLFAQMTVNTGMTIGVLPITGMTLPFVSYGGSSLVSTWLMVGVLLSIAARPAQSLARTAFEFDDDEENA